MYTSESFYLIPTKSSSQFSFHLPEPLSYPNHFLGPCIILNDFLHASTSLTKSTIHIFVRLFNFKYQVCLMSDLHQVVKFILFLSFFLRQWAFNSSQLQAIGIFNLMKFFFYEMNLIKACSKLWLFDWSVF